MSIAITANEAALAQRADAIVRLAASGLTRSDIEEVTGYSREAVESALGPEPRIEARGPLSAVEIAALTGMPLGAAKLMVR